MSSKYRKSNVMRTCNKYHMEVKNIKDRDEEYQRSIAFVIFK